jgi:hypothetical protein
MVKDHAYAANTQNLDDLKQSITQVIASILVEMCHCAVHSVFNCTLVCVENDGQQDERAY